jgi:hypothetical protein
MALLPAGACTLDRDGIQPPILDEPSDGSPPPRDGAGPPLIVVSTDARRPHEDAGAPRLDGAPLRDAPAPRPDASPPQDAPASPVDAPGGGGDAAAPDAPRPDVGADRVQDEPIVDASPPERGPIGHWRLDDGAGSPTAHDSSGHGNTATLRRLAPEAWVPGRIDGALSFVTGWLSAPPSASLDRISGALTIAAWIRREPGGGDFQGILSRQVGSSNREHYYLMTTPRGLRVVLATNQPGGLDLRADVPIPSRRWVHVATTWDGLTARLYHDGRVVAAGIFFGRLPRDRTPVVIGGNVNGPEDRADELFPGAIDEVLLYDRALDGDEIRRLAEGEVRAPW